MSSVLSPMDSPVRGSAMPGSTGRRYLKRNPSQGPSRPSRRLGAITLEQELLKPLRIDDRRIAHRIDAASDGAVDLPERDLVAESDRGLEARAASALQIETRRFRGKTAAEHRFARQIPLARVFHDGARGHFVDALALQPIFIDDGAQRCGQHLLVSNLCIGAVAARERNAHAADYGDASRSGSDQHMCTSCKVRPAYNRPMVRILHSAPLGLAVLTLVACGSAPSPPPAEAPSPAPPNQQVSRIVEQYWDEYRLRNPENLPQGRGHALRRRPWIRYLCRNFSRIRWRSSVGISRPCWRFRARHSILVHA